MSKAPFYDMERDGVTQSAIAVWLSCRQKARLYFQGWDSKFHKDAFTYGNIGHGALEHAYLDIMAGKLNGVPSAAQARRYCDTVEKIWLAENVRPSEDALKSLELSLALIEKTLPIYFDYWREDFKKKEWVSLEEKFVFYLTLHLRDNTTVKIPVRGKKDGMFKQTKGSWLFETKFKSLIDESGILDTLSIDIQVLLYLLQELDASKQAPRGVLYNVVRRTMLRQAAKEDVVKFAKRVEADMKKRSDFYFMRMEAPISPEELLAFKQELMGIVTEMYEWYKGIAPHYKNTHSCTSKYGKCQYLPICSREDYSSLAKRKVVFKELEENAV